MLTMQQVDRITRAFYACFCGMEVNDCTEGVYFVCAPQRNMRLKGFGCRYTVYALERDGALVVCYAPEYAGLMAPLKGKGKSEVLEGLTAAVSMKKMQLMILRQEHMQDYGNARILTKADYPLYERFFRQVAPMSNPTGWLQTYFEEKVAKEYFVGYVKDGNLVSVCDAPDMPYMEEEIQHTGIETLAAQRRQGYALRTAALAAHHLMEKGICPQWECRAENAASIGLAKKIGYEPFGMAYILEE